MNDTVALWDIRPAALVDAPQLAALDAQTSPHSWSLTQFETACAGAGALQEQVLVIGRGSQLCGFVVCSLVVDEASIHNIAVSPDFRRQGLAARLLEAALAVLRGQDASRCFLEVRASNAAAIALYGGFEFQQDGRRSNYYPSVSGREDALLMSRSL